MVDFSMIDYTDPEVLNKATEKARAEYIAAEKAKEKTIDDSRKILKYWNYSDDYIEQHLKNLYVNVETAAEKEAREKSKNIKLPGRDVPRPDYLDNIKEFSQFMFADKLDVGHGYIGYTYVKEKSFGPKLPEEYKPIYADCNGKVRHVANRGTINTVLCTHANKIQDEITKLNFYYCDYFMTLNRYITPRDCKLTEENLFGYNALMIDIHDHRPKLSGTKLKAIIENYTNKYPDATTKELDTIFGYYQIKSNFPNALNNLKFGLMNDLFTQDDFPQPNYINVTGQGIQLIWKLDPVSARNSSQKKFYKTVADDLIKRVDKFLEDNNHFGSFVVNKRKSGKPNAMIRIPETYNRKMHVFAELTKIHSNSMSLYEQAKIIWNHAKSEYKAQKELKKKQREEQKKKYAEKRTSLEYAFMREQVLYKHLEHMNKQNPCCNELRDMNTFIIFNAFFTATHNVSFSMDRVNKMNKKFRTPLSDDHIKKLLSASIKKNGYLLTNQYVIDNLDITPDERNEYDFHAKKKVYDPETVRKNKENREKRNKTIVRHCDEGSFSEQELKGNFSEHNVDTDFSQQNILADMKYNDGIKTSASTICRTLKKEHRISPKQQLHNAILFDCKRGRTMKHIKKKYAGAIEKGYISLSGIYYIRAKAAKWREKLEQYREQLKAKKEQLTEDSPLQCQEVDLFNEEERMENRAKCKAIYDCPESMLKDEKLARMYDAIYSDVTGKKMLSWFKESDSSWYYRLSSLRTICEEGIRAAI